MDSRDDRPEPDSALILEGIQALHDRLDELERRIAPGERPGLGAPAASVPSPGGPAPAARVPGGPALVPAWKRPTEGEARWQAAVAVALQYPLPGRLVLPHPVRLLPKLQGLLLVALVMANPRRINTESRAIRLLGLMLAALLSLANAWSVARLVVALVQGTEGNSAGPLLVTGGTIWLVNVIVFALWYREFDRGPVARAQAVRMFCGAVMWPCAGGGIRAPVGGARGTRTPDGDARS